MAMAATLQAVAAPHRTPNTSAAADSGQVVANGCGQDAATSGEKARTSKTAHHSVAAPKQNFQANMNASRWDRTPGDHIGITMDDDDYQCISFRHYPS